MIILRVLHLAVVFSLLVTVYFGVTVSSLGVVDGELQYDSKLFLSGYQRDDLGKNLRFFQLYNGYNKPIDVSKWNFYIDEIDESHRIQFSPNIAGEFIKPNGHVVVTEAGYVTGATYSIESMPVVSNERSATFIIVPPVDSNERTLTYILRYAGDSTKVTTDDYFDDVWLRSQSTSAGYNSTFSITTTTEIFDNGLYSIPALLAKTAIEVVEVYPYSSDCAPNDEAVLCGDYIKIHVDKSADYSQFVLRTSNNSSSRTSSNTFFLGDYQLSDEGYITIAKDEDGKRLNITNSGGYIWLEDLYGLKVYNETMTEYISAGSDKQGYAWALSDDGKWYWTTAPRPGSANRIIEPVKQVTVCPEGKYLNPDTGRCRTLEEAVNALSACPEGQERNPLTNRCRAKVVASTALAPCGEGQERNPLTNRCRSIASAVAELLPCNEGYERNPLTNRCRKVAGVSTATMSATPKQVVGSEQSTGWNIWTWSLVFVAVGGAVAYGVHEWRREIIDFGRAIAVKFGKK